MIASSLRKDQDLEEPEQPVLRLPEGTADLVRVAGKAARRIRLAALEEDGRSAGLRQAIGRDRPTEARADDDGIAITPTAVPPGCPGGIEIVRHAVPLPNDQHPLA